MEQYIKSKGIHPAGLGGTQTIYKFPNGYGASVISGEYFYTDIEHPYELGVLKFDDEGNGHITYETPITDDVIGHLTEEDVQDTLLQIKALPMKQENTND